MLGVDSPGEGFGGGSGKLPCLHLLEPQAPYLKIEDKTFILRGRGESFDISISEFQWEFWGPPDAQSVLFE